MIRTSITRALMAFFAIVRNVSCSFEIFNWNWKTQVSFYHRSSPVMKCAMDVFAQKKSQKTILIPKFVIISNLFFV